MTDIFHEVEEEVRRERLEKIWKEYGDYIIGAVALIIMAVAAFELWRVYEQKQRTKASEGYLAATQIMQSGQAAYAAQIFAQIARTAPSGYAKVARVQEADALLTGSKRTEAIALYREIIAGNDPELAAVGRIHLAWALVGQVPRPEIDALLAPLSAPGNAWSAMAREILAYEDYSGGNLAVAIKEYESLAADSGNPEGVRQRAKIMAMFLKAGGEKNYGTVPQPPQQQHASPGSPPAPGGPAPK